MARVEVTILGSGTCAATQKRSMAGYHLQYSGKQALLDVGDGALRRLLEAGLNYRQIDAIFISHLHIDHIADLVPFLWATRYTPDFHRTNLLEIFGPPGTEEWYQKLAAAFGNWMLELPFPIQFHEGEDTGWPWATGQVKTLPMFHSVPVNGYRFECNGHILVYTGDTGFHENVIRLARAADLLIIESSFPDREESVDTHLTPGLVGKIATTAQVKKVILTHLYPECETVDIVAQCRQFFAGEIELAQDLKRFTL